MKKLLSVLSILGAIGAVVVFPMLQVGCEEADGVDGLTISPSAHSFFGDEGRKTFTAYSGAAVSDTNGVVSAGTSFSPLALPLVWSVSDSTLGSIVASSGATAIYERTAANGVNTITVRDQYDNEGYATVSQ